MFYQSIEDQSKSEMSKMDKAKEYNPGDLCKGKII